MNQLESIATNAPFKYQLPVGSDLRTDLGFVVLIVIVVCTFRSFWILIKLHSMEPKMLVGLFSVLALFIVSLIIALAHVAQDTSYGLGEAIGGLIALATQFASWAFRPVAKEKADETKGPTL